MLLIWKTRCRYSHKHDSPLPLKPISTDLDKLLKQIRRQKLSHKTNKMHYDETNFVDNETFIAASSIYHNIRNL